MKVVTISSMSWIPPLSLIYWKAVSMIDAFLIYWSTSRFFSLFFWVNFFTLIFMITMGLEKASPFCPPPSSFFLLSNYSSSNSIYSSFSFNFSWSFLTSSSNFSFEISCLDLRERMRLLDSLAILKLLIDSEEASVILLLRLLIWFSILFIDSPAKLLQK